MARIGIVVHFTIKPGFWQAFDAHIREHARRTLAEEAGCAQFDVLQPLAQDGSPDHGQMMVYEIYKDQAAFEVHRNGPRMAPFGEKSKTMLDGRVLTLCALDFNAAAISKPSQTRR